MWITEYNEEMSHAMFRQQGFEEGREEGYGEGYGEGKEQGLIEGVAGFVKNGIITLAQAAERFEMTEEEFAQKAAELGIDVR